MSRQLATHDGEEGAEEQEKWRSFEEMKEEATRLEQLFSAPV